MQVNHYHKGDKMSKVQELIATAMSTEDNADSLWAKTGEIVQDNKLDFFDADPKASAKLFVKALDTEHDSSVLPTDPVMSRTGEKIDLLKANGKVKWSSWVVTARIVQNTSDIWKGIDLLGYDTVFPSGLIVSRYELRKMIKDASEAKKTPETPLETISRCLELVAKKLSECEKSELDSINQRFIEVNVAHSEWKESL